MADIVLTTQNATYAHAALGLRSLLANLGPLRARARIREFTLAERPVDIAEQILSERPRIVGLGVYVWNARPALELARLVKQVAPETVLVIGGPEVSHGCERMPIAAIADYVIAGEGEQSFRDLAVRLLDEPTIPGTAAQRADGPGGARVIVSPPPELATLALPYDLYDEKDLLERVIYVESSRGCPFTCQFCLSALEPQVRTWPLDAVLVALGTLWERGLRRFRFVDRTFNVDAGRGRAILDFFLARLTADTFVHLEAVPELFPESVRERIARFPPGALQLEVGVQTLDEEVATRIGRRMRRDAVLASLRWLRAAGPHVHADLIVGLPGEGVEALARTFDALVATAPHEIQVGILKRLPGASIDRHTEAFAMVYADEPPYEILQNRDIDFATMQRLKRFARYWDQIANSGNFRESAPRLWGERSPFASFLGLSDWLYAATGRSHGLSLERLCELLLTYFVTVLGLDAGEVRTMLQRDYMRAGRRALPALLGPNEKPPPRPRPAATGLPRRQARHR